MKETAIGVLCVLALSMTQMSAAQAEVNNRSLANEANGTNWAAYGRTFSTDHFSPLKQINAKNVGKLGLAWYYDLPIVNSVYTTPLAVNGILYVPAGFSVIRAMDAKTGKVLWTYDPKVTAHSGVELRGGWGIRGIAYWEGKVYTGTHDGRLIALNAKTGKLVWSVKTTTKGDGRYITGAPLVFNNKVLIGNGGGDFEPSRGYVTCYNAQTGKKLWRFYTIPGNPAKGFKSKAMAMAAKTWKGQYWKIAGGGMVWNAMVYDPQFNRVYIGTGNGQPWNQKIRSPGGGDNLFTDSIVALNANTGAYVWHYQVNPGGMWDYDAALDIEMATLKIDGKKRPVLMQASKNGFYYVIDRKTGKLLSANQYGKQNWAKYIDLKTGRPVENPAARLPHDKPFAVIPGPEGDHQTEPMAYSPITKYAYIPSLELGTYLSVAGVKMKGWKPAPNMFINNGYNHTVAAPPGALPPPSSSLVAWNVLKGKAAWTVPLTGIINGGATATAGNLVFQGRANGQLVAYAADSGKKLWSYNAEVGIVSPPIIYEVGDKEYMTIVVGYGGQPAIFGAPFGWGYYTQKRRVLTFRLGGKATLPPEKPHTPVFATDPSFVVNPAKAAKGADIVDEKCMLCHGPGLASGGGAPDLRKSKIPLSKAEFTNVLHNGALEPLGMPQFQELTDVQIEDLRNYIQQQARIAAKAVASKSK